MQPFLPTPFPCALKHVGTLAAHSTARHCTFTRDPVHQVTQYIPECVSLKGLISSDQQSMVPCLPRLLSAHVACVMPVKRKFAAAAVCAPVQTSDGSRFIDCPACSQRVAHYLINSHLDSECGRSTSSPADVKKEAADARQLHNRSLNSIVKSGPCKGRSRLPQDLVEVHVHIA